LAVLENCIFWKTAVFTVYSTYFRFDKTIQTT